MRIAVPFETVQDFLSTLQPAYKPSTVPVVAQTLEIREPKKTNFSRRMKAAKRKLAATDSALETPSKRAKSTADVVTVVPAEPAYEAPPTVMKPKPPMDRVPLGHKAYDREGNLILMPYEDDEDLIMPEQVRNMPTGRKSLLRIMAEGKRNDEKKAARAAFEEQERLNARPSLENEIDAQPSEGVQSMSTTVRGINTNQVQEHSGPASDTQTPRSSGNEASQPNHTQNPVPGHRGLFGSLMGSVRKFVPNLRRTQSHTVAADAAHQVGPSDSAPFSQTSALAVNDTANMNNTSTNDAISGTVMRVSDSTEIPRTNSTTHQPPLSDVDEIQETSIGDSLRVPIPSLASWEEKKSVQKKQRKMEAKQKAKKARLELRDKTIEDEVSRRVVRELAVLTGSKRKRYSPDRIPNPVGVSYGMDDQFFGSDSESDEEAEDVSEESPSLRPAKRQRSQIIGDPHRATPYTGTIFADPKANLFQPPKPKASFTVPESSSDEHSDELDTTPTVPKNKGNGKEVQFADKVHFSGYPADRGAIGTFHTSEPLKSAMKATNKPDESWQQDPPPTPSPSHAELPTATPTLPTPNPSGDTDALARARSQALRYTPAIPSGLRAATRLSSSLIATPSDAVDSDRHSEFTGNATQSDGVDSDHHSEFSGNATPSNVAGSDHHYTFAGNATPSDVADSDHHFEFTGNTTPSQVADTEDRSYYTGGSEQYQEENSNVSEFAGGFEEEEGFSVNEGQSEYTEEIDETDNDEMYDPTGAFDISHYRVLGEPTLEIRDDRIICAGGILPSRAELEEMDQDVRAAVDALSDSDLAQIEFPPSRYLDHEMDPEVAAALERNWGIEDENRATCVFNDTYVDWVTAKMKAGKEIAP